MADNTTFTRGHMTELEIAHQERRNHGTTWTRNSQFDKDGYIIVKKLWNPEELYHPCPRERGQMSWWGKGIDQFESDPEEKQVLGSLARYTHPQYRVIHLKVGKKIEKEIGRTLYPTYYYDRFYFEGQELHKHADRDACEISVTVHISTNLPEPESRWPIWFKTPDTYTDKTKRNILVPGENRCAVLEPGDGVIYKGCERPHWRHQMPSPKPKRRFFGKEQKVEYYYHQIFFHYVLQDGNRAQCAWDKAS